MQDEHSELRKLIEENIALTEENNRLLKLIRRDAMVGLIAKVILWLIVLGLPLLILSTYIGPLIEAFTATGTTPGTGLFGVPSPEQMKEAMQQYKALYEGQ